MQRASDFPPSDSGHSEPKYAELDRHSSSWKTGFRRRFPLLGGGCLLLAMAAILGCVAVLISSNGQPIETWPLASRPMRPSILLAIFSATANICLRTALSEGLDYTWWVSAVRGTTLGKLQHYWDHGTSLPAALFAGRHLNWISIACVAVSLVVVDGPLLQRASSTRLATIHTEGAQVNATVAAHLAYGQTGYRKWNGSGAIMLGKLSLLTPSFRRVLEDYNTKQPISAAKFSGCEGTCSGLVEAAGFYRDCSESQTQRTWFGWDGLKITDAHPGVVFSTNLEWGHSSSLQWVSQPPLDVNPIPEGIPADEPFIWLNVSYATETFKNESASQYMSNMVHKSCKLYSATRKYPITIYNDTTSNSATTSALSLNTITLSGDSEYVPDSIQNQRRDTLDIATSLGFEDPTNNPWKIFGQIGLFADYSNTSMPYARPVYETLSGISTAVQGLVGSNVTFKGLVSNSTRSLFDMSGSLAMQLLDADDVGEDSYFNLQWQDPSPSIFATLDELMFRSAISAAHNNTLERLSGYNADNPTDESFDPLKTPASAFPEPQIISMPKQQTVLIYESKYLFLGISVGIMFLSTILVVPTFYGFWTLGRGTSLNPVVTALAFRAPVLDDLPSNSSEKKLLKKAGAREVQYGEALLSRRNSSGAAFEAEAETGQRERLLMISSVDKVRSPAVNGTSHY
ncbi:hypothetical protein FQN54_003940 [Arachnomyces sp. PD_36]|nr:hypothetical protein FQN54_003940 [Arachnomyces sp. PD_36]